MHPPTLQEQLMNKSITKAVAALAILTCGIATAEDTPCEERVSSDCAWASNYPFNTIGNLRWPADDGMTSVATAFLVSPHCALTNGHCVYNREAGQYIPDEQTFIPGACRSGTGGLRSQFGSRTVRHKKTNNKWADTSYTPRQGVDYGAVQFVCPFSEITTFMPLCFGYESDWAHMAGYPVNSLPDSTKMWNQWIAYGDVSETHNRWARYDARSTGGASGSPVWNWRNNSSLVDVFAINSTHWNDCDGGGPRLVSQNEDLIRKWMRWEPTFGELMAEGCIEWQIMPWDGLLNYFNNNDHLRFEPNEIQIVNPVGPPPTGPSRRYMQIIERGYYEWVEYDLIPNDPNSNRLIQLLVAPEANLPGEAWAPGMAFDPQTQGWLSVEKAIALLSGSAGRASARVMGLEQIEIDDMGEEIFLLQPQPDDFAGEQDPSKDQEGPTDETSSCLGDLNDDGLVNGADLGLILGAWGICTTPDCQGDLNGDGKVNGADLGLILGAWGFCS